ELEAEEDDKGEADGEQDRAENGDPGLHLGHDGQRGRSSQEVGRQDGTQDELPRGRVDLRLPRRPDGVDDPERLDGVAHRRAPSPRGVKRTGSPRWRRSRCGTTVYFGSRAEAWPASKIPIRVQKDPPSRAAPLRTAPHR